VRYGRSVDKGFLPIYSVDTEEEARELLVAACPTNMNGEFIAPELVRQQTLENLYSFGSRLEKMHGHIKRRKRAALRGKTSPG
jgi:hypothetical protein